MLDDASCRYQGVTNVPRVRASQSDSQKTKWQINLFEGIEVLIVLESDGKHVFLKAIFFGQDLISDFIAVAVFQVRPIVLVA